MAITLALACFGCNDTASSAANQRPQNNNETVPSTAGEEPPGSNETAASTATSESQSGNGTAPSTVRREPSADSKTAPSTAGRERLRSPDDLPAFELRFSYTDEGLFSPGAPNARSEELLYNPTSVAVSEDDEIFVLDSGNQRIVVLTPQGRVIRTFGRRGQGPGEFDLRGSWDKIALGPNRVAVLEQQQSRVKIMDRNGDLVAQFDLVDSATRLTSTPDFIVVTTKPSQASRPQIHVYDWGGVPLRSLSESIIPVDLAPHTDWLGLNSSTAASLDGEEVVKFLQYWPIAILEDSRSKYLDFPWATGNSEMSYLQPAAESLEAAQKFEGTPPRDPIIWDVEPVAAQRSWALLLNGGIIQFLDEDFTAGTVGWVLPAWQGDRFVALDIGINPSGSMLCAAGPLNNQLNCYDVMAW